MPYPKANLQTQGRGLDLDYTVGDRVIYNGNGRCGYVKEMRYESGIPAEYVVAVLMDDGELLKNMSASNFWPAPIDTIMIPINITVESPKVIDHWPHKCPKCNGKAFIGFKEIDCMFGCYRKINRRDQ